MPTKTSVTRSAVLDYKDGTDSKEKEQCVSLLGMQTAFTLLYSLREYTQAYLYTSGGLISINAFVKSTWIE